MRKFLPKNTRVRLAFNAIATMAVGTTALCCFVFLWTYIPGYLCDLDLAKVTTHEIVLDDVDIKAIRRGQNTLEVMTFSTDLGDCYFALYDDLWNDARDAYRQFEDQNVIIAIYNKHTLLPVGEYFKHFDGWHHVVAIADRESESMFNDYNTTIGMTRATYLIGGTVFLVPFGLLFVAISLWYLYEYKILAKRIREKKQRKKI